MHPPWQHEHSLSWRKASRSAFCCGTVFSIKFDVVLRTSSAVAERVSAPRAETLDAGRSASKGSSGPMASAAAAGATVGLALAAGGFACADRWIRFHGSLQALVTGRQQGLLRWAQRKEPGPARWKGPAAGVVATALFSNPTMRRMSALNCSSSAICA